MRLFLLDSDVAENAPRTGRSRRTSTAATTVRASARSCSSASAACAPCAALGVAPERSSPQRGALRLRPARGRPPADGCRGARRSTRRARRVASRTVFTTHTPVPAGHDRFDAALVDEHLGPAARRDRALREDELLALGRVRGDDADELFCMTVLALKLSRFANGVSSLHGDVAPAHVAAPVALPGATSRCPSGTSPTACTCRAGWPSPCSGFSTGTCRVAGRSSSSEAEIWDGIDTIDDAELWRDPRHAQGAA